MCEGRGLRCACLKNCSRFFWDRSLLIFLIIGGLNTLVSMVGSQLLYGALGYWGATALMFTVCSVFSFIFNRKYSFESKAPLLQSAVRFFCGHRGVLPHQLRPFGFSGADVHGALLSRCFHRLAGAHRHAGSAGDLYRLQLSGAAPVGFKE